MQTERRIRSLSTAGLWLAAIACAGCNSVIGLNDLSVRDEAGESPGGECEINADCSAKLGAAAACVGPENRCVPLLSEDCDVVTGDPEDGEVIILGSLFSTQGAQAETNKHRQQAAMLAVNQINQLGGIPRGGGGTRKLVMVSCNETENLDRVGAHLVNELRVPGIVGPNTSQDTIELTNRISARGGTVLMTPSAVASAIGALDDNHLTWLMVPNDEQRAPLMIRQLNAIETRLRNARGVNDVKLSIVSRGDALGQGTRKSLSSLRINGRTLSDQIGGNVLIDEYDFNRPDQTAIVEKHLTFRPDMVVLAGTAEAITQVMVPLEAGWPSGAPRPEYVLIDSVKVPELITAATGNDDLRRRVRGTGIVPGPDSVPVYESFKVDYLVANPAAKGRETTSGMGPAYDAVYSMAYAIAAAGDQPVSGDVISTNLGLLAGGSTKIEVGSTNLTRAFQRLGAGESIDAVGTFGHLEWDQNGAVVGGTLEMWCIGIPSGSTTPSYRSSGLTFDLRTETESGQYTQCGP